MPLVNVMEPLVPVTVNFAVVIVTDNPLPRPRLVLAPDAVFAPVPPDVIGIGTEADRVVKLPVEGVVAPIGVLLTVLPAIPTPPMEPPVIATELAFSYAIVPKVPVCWLINWKTL